MKKPQVIELASDREFQVFVSRKLVELEAFLRKLCKKELCPELVIFKRPRRQQPAPADTKE